MSFEDLGKRIQQARDAKNMTQQRLAELVGVTQQTVANWEQGALPKLSRIERLSSVLGVNLMPGGLAGLLPEEQTAPDESPVGGLAQLEPFKALQRRLPPMGPLSQATRQHLQNDLPGGGLLSDSATRNAEETTDSLFSTNFAHLTETQTDWLANIPEAERERAQKLMSRIRELHDSIAIARGERRKSSPPPETSESDFQTTPVTQQTREQMRLIKRLRKEAFHHGLEQFKLQRHMDQSVRLGGFDRTFDYWSDSTVAQLLPSMPPDLQEASASRLERALLPLALAKAYRPDLLVIQIIVLESGNKLLADFIASRTLAPDYRALGVELRVETDYLGAARHINSVKMFAGLLAKIDWRPKQDANADLDPERDY